MRAHRCCDWEGPLRVPHSTLVALAVFTFAPPLAPALQGTEVDYEADVAFALDLLEEHCGHFFDL